MISVLHRRARGEFYPTTLPEQELDRIASLSFPLAQGVRPSGVAHPLFQEHSHENRGGYL